MRHFRAVALALAVAAAVGCAAGSATSGPPVSRKRVTDALEMIKRAEEHDGSRDARASELRGFAWREYDEAKKQALDGSNTRAGTQLARAEADAALAVALSEKNVAEEQAREVSARLAAAKAKSK